MFKITEGKGFQITFENGIEVSVQFGPGNYADNRSRPYSEAAQCGEEGSLTAEVAVFDSEGKYVRLPAQVDNVRGWETPEDVLYIMNWAASYHRLS